MALGIYLTGEMADIICRSAEASGVEPEAVVHKLLSDGVEYQSILAGYSPIPPELRARVMESIFSPSTCKEA